MSSNFVRSLIETLDWTPVRKPPEVGDYELSGKAQIWLQSVPIHSRPLLLSRRYPRIVNKLAEVWATPKDYDKYMASLLVDERGTRQGFAPEIVEELQTLHSFVLRVRTRVAQ